MKNALNPLPSLICASAMDAAHAQMRAAGRSKWNRADFNKAAEVQEGLTRACYGYEDDDPASPLCYIRFGIARSLEAAGRFHLRSNMASIYAAIDATLTE